MTRKHYRLLAEEFAKMVKGLEQPFAEHHLPVIRELVNNLSDKLQEDNPRFDRHTFWKACGL